jgi:hypothetical protein
VREGGSRRAGKGQVTYGPAWDPALGVRAAIVQHVQSEPRVHLSPTELLFVLIGWGPPVPAAIWPLLTLAPIHRRAATSLAASTSRQQRPVTVGASPACPPSAFATACRRTNRCNWQARCLRKPSHLQAGEQGSPAGTDSLRELTPAVER